MAAALTEIERIVSELEARQPPLSDWEIESIRDIRAAAQRGGVHPDDLRYLQNFHARVVGGQKTPPPPVREEEHDLSAAEWKARALKAEEALADLKAQPVHDKAVEGQQ